MRENAGGVTRMAHVLVVEDDPIIRQTVEYALKQMSAYNVSALVMMTDEVSLGIFTERDLVRCHIIFPGKNRLC